MYGLNRQKCVAESAKCPGPAVHSIQRALQREHWKLLLALSVERMSPGCQVTSLQRYNEQRCINQTLPLDTGPPPQNPWWSPMNYGTLSFVQELERSSPCFLWPSRSVWECAEWFFCEKQKDLRVICLHHFNWSACFQEEIWAERVN